SVRERPAEPDGAAVVQRRAAAGRQYRPDAVSDRRATGRDESQLHAAAGRYRVDRHAGRGRSAAQRRRAEGGTGRTEWHAAAGCGNAGGLRKTQNSTWRRNSTSART
ncbi:conserved hypothetical protein, partial [Ricinus communis]